MATVDEPSHSHVREQQRRPTEAELLDVMQSEAISAEIVRTLVGSIGLVLAVPLTTAIGVAVTRRATPTSRRTVRRRRDAEGLVDGDW